MSRDILSTKLLSHDPFLSVNQNNIAIKASQAGSFKVINDVKELSPKGNLGSIFSQSDAYVDFDLPIGGNIDQITGMYLKMVIQNDDGTNAGTIVPAPYLLSRYSILVGGAEVDVIYNDNHWFEELLLHDTEYLQQRSVSEGFDENDLSATTNIAAATTEQLTLKLHNFITQTKMLMSVIKNQITIRFYFRAGVANIRASGTASGFSMASANLIVEGIVYSSAVKTALRNKYMKGTHVYRAYLHRYSQITGQSLSTNENHYAITEFTSKTPLFAVIVKNTAAVDDNYSGFDEMDSFHLLDNNGVALGFQNITSQFDLNNLIPSKFPSNITTFENIYCLPFSFDPVGSIMDGVASGSHHMTSNQQLMLKATASISSRNIVVLAYAESNIIVNNGIVSVAVVNN